MKLVFAVPLLLSLAACSYLGSPPRGALPADVHAAPEPSEIAAHPCRYGAEQACVSRCRREEPGACNAAGAMFEFREDEAASDPTLAARFYGEACKASYGPGCNNLAWLYLRGRGVPADKPHAMFLFMAAFDASKIACYRGDATGCLLAGELLYEGRGVAEDEARALSFFDLACKGGESRGCDGRATASAETSLSRTGK